jgi:tripartite-type tricarboxylate transporter receptor subunit TctC
MKPTIAARVAAAAAILIGAMPAGAALGQDYPARPVRIVVPFPPGGGADTLGRPIAQKLSEKWGQPVVIDNRGGASGMIGAEIVAKSAPDGYTVLLCSSAEVALNVALYPSMTYDPVRDFAPVTQLAVSPLVLVAHPSVPAPNMREFVALAKAQPGRLGYASAGPGSAQHMAGEWMKMLGGIDITHVPYRGGGPQLADLIAGNVQSGFLALPVAVPQLKAGKLRALAVTTARRSPAIPDVSTLHEAGFAGLEVSQWWGVMLPAGTPAAIASRLYAGITEAIALPDIQARMADLGAEPVGSTPAQFGSFIRSEIAKFRKVAKDANVSIN